MLKKIAVIGPQNSGKTTSLYRVGYEIKSNTKVIGMGHELAREQMELTKLGFLGQLTLLHRQMERELRLEEHYTNILTDRSVFDSIAYCKQLHEEGRVTVSDFCMLCDMIDKWVTIHPYYAIIYLTPLPIEDDPQRGPTKTNILKHQLEMNAQFEGVTHMIMEEYPDTQFYAVTVDDKKKRTSEVLQIVDALFFKKGEHIIL